MITSTNPTTRNQSGFSVIEVLLIILVVAALSVTGYVVYQRYQSTSAKNSAASSQTKTTTQPTQYLTIKEWGVKLPLSDTVKDAYYIPGISSKGTDGLPNQMWIRFKSLDGNGCTATTNSGPALIFRALPNDTDPVGGELLTQKYPNGATIGNYYYGYEDFATSSSTTCKAPQTTLQTVHTALTIAAKGIVVTLTTTQYLAIKEWGVRLTLDSTTASLYYYIKPDLPNVAYLSLKTISDIAPNCSADKVSLGAIVRQTPAEQQSAPDAKYSIKGTIQIGNYWYGFSKTPAVCVVNASQDAAISHALPKYNLQELINTFNTLAAD